MRRHRLEINRRQNEGQQGIPGNTENQSGDGQQPDTSQQQQTENQEIPAWQSILFQQRQAAQIATDEAERLRQDNIRLQQQIQNQQQQNQTPLPPDAALNAPQSIVDRINQDVARQVAPLNAFTQEMQRQQNYRIAVGQIARDPQLGPVVANVRQMLDDYFLNTPAAQPTIGAITMKVKEIIADYVLSGAMAQSQNQNQNQNNQNNQNRPINNQQQQTNQGQVNPPHLRPTGAPSNQPQNTNQQYQPDENERRLMRENGYTVGEYIMLRDASPHNASAIWQEILKARKDGKRIQ
jgi:hypothetical protein